MKYPLVSDTLDAVICLESTTIRYVPKVDVSTTGDLNRINLSVRRVRFVPDKRDRGAQVGGRDIVNASIQRNSLERRCRAR